MVLPPGWEEEQFCYVTTTGRRTGRPHEIEIWFAARDHTMYLLAGGGRRADWVRNLEASPGVGLRVAGVTTSATARVVDDRKEGERARRQLAAKYQGWSEGQEMSGWARTGLCIALDMDGGA